MYQVLIKENGEFKTLYPCVWSSLNIALGVASDLKKLRSQSIVIYKFTGSGAFESECVAVIR